MNELPVGSIILWSSGTIPAGWAVCNGANGTPDLRDRFVRGAKADAELRGVGGVDNHYHSLGNTDAAGGHSHTGSADTMSQGNNLGVVAGSGNTAATTHSHGGSQVFASIANHTHSIGNSGAANNLPRHIKRVFIMRVS